MSFIKKTLLLAMAASIQASPLAASSSTSSIAPPEETTIPVGDWTPPAFPEGAVDISNNTALINELKQKAGIEIPPEETSANTGDVTLMSGPCNQGTCPDFDKGFDMMYTWSMQSQPGVGGAPPTTLVWNDFVIRVNDCGKCYSHRVGGTGGGCWDFTSCNRAQSICVDDRNNRAHRVWKDNGHKTCYRMSQVGMGGCGIIQARVIFRPDATTACNW
ncbi:hypothetical protein ACHAPT_002278 [Fusarium lateritium]